LVFAVESESGASELWLRELDSGEARRLDGTEGAAYPFWSPDSQSVGFFTSARLKTLELETRVLRELCDAQTPRGGSWNGEEEIVFTSNGTLFRISSAGGERTTALSIDADLGEDSLRFPSFLPDGEHVLFFARNTIEPRRSGVWVVSLRTGAREQLLETRSRAIYVASGYLLYRQRANLFARAFDPSRLEFTDEPVSVADDIWFDPSISGATSFSASDNGMIVYRTGGMETTQLVWLDREGRELERIWEPASFLEVALSPSGDSVVVGRTRLEDETRQFWLYDFEAGSATQLTLEGEHYRAVWSPDGTRIMMSAIQRGRNGLWEKDVRSGAPADLKVESQAVASVSDWSSDGKWMLFEFKDDGGSLDIEAISIGGDEEIVKIASTRFDETSPQFSPDGRWLAYSSDESGRPEIYVRPFRRPGTKNAANPRQAERVEEETGGIS